MSNVDSNISKGLMDISEGTKLELKVYDEKGEKVELITVSEFQWADDEETAFIAAPIKEGVLYPVHRETNLDVFFLKKEGARKNYSLYHFMAQVVDRFNNDNVEQLMIKLKGDIKRIQRRNFFRFEYTLPVGYKVINTLNPMEYENNRYIKTITKDLSGGGISIRLMEEIKEGKLLECVLELGKSKNIVFIGKALRLSKYDINEKFKYEVGIKFIKIEDRDRERLIKFIFDKQRILRKKGLI